MESYIKEILFALGVEKYVINNDMSVDIYGDLKAHNSLPLDTLKFKINKVYGSLYCIYNGLYSFKNFPDYIEGDFICSSNNLESLEGCPKYIGGFFDCSKNKITSLKGCPEYIGSDFDCTSNQLTSLEGCTNIINGSFNCSINKLTTLKGCPKYIDIFLFDFNDINKIDIETDVSNEIHFYKNKIDTKISNLEQDQLRNLFKYGLDYKIFNDDGSINVKQLKYFLNDFNV